jgi:hypothetical protein
MSANAATPWGAATVLEEVGLSQEADGKEFASVVQLLELAGGERLLRFAYSTDGRNRRGPVTLRARDIQQLRKALARKEGLAAALAPLAP